MASLLSLRSSHTATIDGLRAENASALVQVLGVVGFALLTALGAQLHLRIYLWEVPITLGTVAVYASGLCLGARNGVLAQLLYIALGLFLPVYAGDGFAPAYFYASASAGYIVGYPLAAAIIGLLSTRWKTLSGSVLAMLAGSAVLFTCGVTWLHYAAGHASWLTSINHGWLRFALFDLLKILAIGGLYTGLRRL